MSDLGKYLHAQETTARRRAERDLASANLELARIQELAAEMRSQHEPLDTLTGGDKEERERILKAIFYVTVGRWPS